MDRGRRDRKSDIYSTFVVHDEVDEEGRGDEEGKRGWGRKPDDDLYATMVYKDEQDEEEDNDDDDDPSLPPLLKRLPKDFGAAIGDFDDEDEEEGGDFGTMIVKPSRDSSSKGSSRDWKSRSDPYTDRTFKRKYDDESEEDEEGGGEEGFSTFVVKKGGSESVSGTVVTRSGVGGGGNVGFGGSTTMGRAVASMQAIGEMGGGRQKKASASSSSQIGEEGGRIFNRGSTSSLPECFTREDPSTKYEMLNELGKGSYGSVFKARDLKTSELVAIKVISLSEGV